MKVGSLFSGIGGLELGLEWAGMEVAWQVEYDSYCQKVLAERWPNVKRYGDIYEVKGTELEWVDVICGGFPCQPFSHAGKRKGTADSRWLWPEFYRIICEVRPRWVIIENVPGLLSIDSGRVFAGILRNLADAGYDAEWRIISAADVGARHLRKRVFIVAHAINAGSGTPESGTDGNGTKKDERRYEQSLNGFGGRSIFNPAILAYLRQRNTGPGGIWEYDPADVPDPQDTGLEARCSDGLRNVEGEGKRPTSCGCSAERGNPDVPDPDQIRLQQLPKEQDGTWEQNIQTQSQRESGYDGEKETDVPDPRSERIWQETRTIRCEGSLPPENGQRLRDGADTNNKSERESRPASPGMGIVADGIPGAVDYNHQPRVGHKIEERVNRLKCLGNAVVPQVAEYVGLCIMNVIKTDTD